VRRLSKKEAGYNNRRNHSLEGNFGKGGKFGIRGIITVFNGKERVVKIFAETGPIKKDYGSTRGGERKVLLKE